MEVQEPSDLCFPQMLNGSCRKPGLPWTSALLLDVFLSCISPTTVLLNLLVIISVSHFRQISPSQQSLPLQLLGMQLRTPTNALLLSLAVSDFLVGLLLMPGEILRNTSCWFLGDFLCSLYIYMVCQIVSSSIGSIVLISVDRYVAICHPLHYTVKVTLSRVRVCACLCWLGASAYSLFYVKDDLFHPGRNHSCSGECTFIISDITGLVDLVINFVLAISTIVALYMRVFVVAVSQARAVHSRVVGKARRSELKAARTLGVLVFVYLACFCPYYGYSLVEVSVTSTAYAPFLIFVFYLNSCLNPIIYSLFYPWFRKSIRLIVTLRILQPVSSEANLL